MNFNGIPFYQEEKLAIFIDGSNLYAAAKALDIDIDYKRLLTWITARGRLVRSFYYTALMEDQEYSPIRPLVDWLDYNGYSMVTKPAREFTDQFGRKKIKGNMDIELAIDMMEIADNVDHIMLFSGDGDFRRLIEAVQRKGVRVTVVSSIKTSPPMVSDELRRQADHFLDLDILGDYIMRSSKRKVSDRDDDDDGDYDDYDDEVYGVDDEDEDEDSAAQFDTPRQSAPKRARA
ncbi:MAG: NYN domain-containing protein [Alphaproteobacteria bacterium]